MQMLMAARVTVAVAVMNLAQVLPGLSPVVVPPWIGVVERLSFQGALILAVGILARAYQQKDAALLALTKTVSELTATTSAIISENRETLKESVRAKDELRESIERLSEKIGPLVEDTQWRHPGGKR